MKIPFHLPTISKNIIELCDDSIKSGWLTTGPKVKEFEEKLKNYLNSEYVIALNSCTAALHLGLISSGIKSRDRFIVPTYTFAASVEIGEYLGAVPVLVDCDSKTFNLDLNIVEDKLKKDVKNSIKVIVPVHFAGLANDMKNIHYLAQKYKLFVLEDAAHSLESFSNLGKVGDTNFAAAFSFYANKNITTGGEGGALSTNNPIIANKVKKLSLHGMNKDGWKRFERGAKWSYDISDLGYKYNMTDISASFGLDQISNVDKWRSKRLKIVKKYNEAFKKIKGLIEPQYFDNSSHAWHLYIIRICSEQWRIDRNKLIELINLKGIGTSVHYKPIHLHSYYKNKYNFLDSEFPNAQNNYNSVISLPLYPKLTLNEINYIIDVITELWNEYKK